MANWYLQSGKDWDVILNTKVRISRNINGFNFVNKCSKEEKLNILEKIEEIYPQIGYNLNLLKIAGMDEITRETLVEKGIVPRDFIRGDIENKAILLNDDENICIMINNIDHLEIEVFSSGEGIEDVSRLALEIEQKIEEHIGFSYNEKYGFLTASPANIGTGINIFVACHMPGLVHTGNINQMLRIVNRFNMNIDERGSKKSDIYTISNGITLGVTEEEIIQNLLEITSKIIDKERLARKYLTNDGLTLEDNVYRAFGTLKYARTIKYDEAKTLISDIKMGTDLGIINELDDNKISKLFYYIKPSNMQKYFNEEMDLKSQNIKRTEIINLVLDEKI